MRADSRVPEIMDNYRKLCAYCDSIWNHVREAYPNEIACRKGCGICCELQSVNQIEAYAIRFYIVNNKNLSGDCVDSIDSGLLRYARNDGHCEEQRDEATCLSRRKAIQLDGDMIVGTGNTDACPFLRRQACAIYPNRPIICRTHGLILRSSEFPLSRQAASCPYNFPSIHPDDFPPELAVDVDLITKNLVNLNLAFCLASGVDVRDETVNKEIRVPLRDLAEDFFC